MRIVLAVVLAVSPAVAVAQGKPRTLEDCEKIDAPLAYNACLASFGPKRGERAAPASMPPADEGETAAGRSGAAARAKPAIPGIVSAGKTRGGRSFAVFDVGPAKPKADKLRADKLRSRQPGAR